MNDPWHRNPDYFRAPNISGDPDLIENLAADRDGTVEAAMRRIHPWDDAVVMDVGAGTGFHIEHFHREAAHAIAVEPDPTVRLALVRRLVDRGLEHTSVIGPARR